MMRTTCERRAINLILRALTVAAFLGLGGFSAAGGQDIKVFVLVPPEQVLEGVQKLAVLDFGGAGQYGGVLANYLIEQLMDDARGLDCVRTGLLGMGKCEDGKSLQEGAITNVFELVERSRLADVLREQRLGEDRIVDEDQAARVGKVLGVDAVLAGTLTASFDQDSTREIWEYTENGQKFQVLVTCISRQVKASGRIRVTHSETARILATTERSADGGDKKCEPNLDQIKQPDELIAGPLGEIATSLADYLAPRFEQQKFDLKQIKTKPHDVPAKRAGKLAEDLEVDRAYAIYNSVYEQDPYNPNVLHNLAVLHEVVGNNRQAAEFYDMACQLKDDKDCRRGKERTAKALAFQESLVALGVQIAEHDFSAAGVDVAAATAKQAEVRGKREERISVYAEPREGSEIIAGVPGGITLPILGEDGDWYRVRLLGGKEGYILREKVKVRS